MGHQLHKYGLEVLGFGFLCGRSCLESLRVNSKRHYILNEPVAFDIYTTQGTLHVVTAAGFEFDGRSGPKIVDWYTPNLGTLAEILCWLAHDCNGYGQDLDFTDTNLLLFVMLRDLAKYRTSKAAVIQFAVSLSKSWYGTPKENEWCYKNIGKVSTTWIPAKV